MAYQHSWSSTEDRRRATPRRSSAVPAVAPTYSRCPACNALGTDAGRRDFGCRGCGQGKAA